MPIAPAPVIQSQRVWKPFDTSGVAFDYTKLATMPPSLYETEGFRMQLGEHGLETTRVFRCHWSDVAAAMQWFYGYSYLADQRILNGKAISPNGAPPTSQPQGPSSHTLSRVPPAQDWYLPYLYADHVELVECLGVPLQDPGLFLTDINGTPIDLTGTPGGTVILRPSLGFPGLGVGPSDIGPVLKTVAPPAPPAGDGPLPGGVGGLPLPEPVLGAVIPEDAEPPGLQMLPGLVFAEQPSPGTFQDGVATLRVTYRQRPYVIRNDAQNTANDQGEMGRYVERGIDYSIQGLPLYNVQAQGQQLIFTEGPSATLAVPEPGAKIISTGALSWIWHDLPFWPQVLTSLQGKVNSDTFDGLAGFPSYPPGTLLCMAPKISWRRNACGQVAFHAQILADYRPDGWNKFPAKDGEFYTATWGGGAPAPDGSNLVFKTAEFAQMFQIGTTFAFV